MSEFPLYVELGFRHITDLKGIDHILFLVALCGIFSASDWKKILWLVTAFTIGHSVTLALSVLSILLIKSNLIETLILITIIITSLSNLFTSADAISASKLRLRYFMALFFGLIHGMGFSNYLKLLLGKESNILAQLLGFNLGLEIGQLLIVSCLMLITFILFKLLKRKQINYVLSSLTGIWAIYLILQNKIIVA